jgi:uncharacterized integral membrane protein (TIGR00698 family)
MNRALDAAPHISRQSWFERARALWPGLVLCATIAIAASFVSDRQGGPAMLYALLLGMALNQLTLDANSRAGVNFAARTVLRTGVALLGARITVDQLGELGWFRGVLIAAFVLATIVFGATMSRVLKLEPRMGILTGGATAICGASAAIAIAAVLPRDERSERELTFTIAGITALSTLAMITYPILSKLLDLSYSQAGIFLGATIHDVAQVVGAGYSLSDDTGDMAVLTKMMRVAMLLPAVLLISFAVRRRSETMVPQVGPLVPRFLIAFVGIVVINSLGLVPKVAIEGTDLVSRACLITAIAAVGLKTSLVEMRSVGGRAMLLLFLETLFLTMLVMGSYFALA